MARTLTPEGQKRIRNMYSSGASLADIQRRTGYARSTVKKYATSARGPKIREKFSRLDLLGRIIGALALGIAVEFIASGLLDI